MLLDALISSETSATRFVELGTYGGALSLHLGLTAAVRGGVLHTFDVQVCCCVCVRQWDMREAIWPCVCD